MPVEQEQYDISIVNLRTAVKAVGCDFYGSYVYSQQYLEKVQAYLASEDIAYQKHSVLGVFFDSPTETASEDCRSFQGVLIDYPVEVDSPFHVLELEGEYVYLKIDPSEDPTLAFEAMLAYVEKQERKLYSKAIHQLRTFKNNELTIELYLELI